MLSFPPSTLVRIFVARDFVDMRKGIDGLAGLVIDVIEQDPQSGHLFVFFLGEHPKPASWERFKTGQ